MAMVTTLVLVGLLFAAVFVSFVAGRLLAGWACGVTDRVPPFGEARPSGFEHALPGARLVITLAGPLAIYVFATLLCVAAFALGARLGQGTTIDQVVSTSPAAAAGLREGDRVISVAGVPTPGPAEVRAVLDSSLAGSVEVLAQRAGEQMRFEVLPGPDRKIGVMFGPNREPLGLAAAIRSGGALPAELLIQTIAGTFKREAGEVAGPVAFVVGTAREPRLADRLLMLGSAATAGLIVFFLASLALWPPRTSRRADPSPADRPIQVVGDANGPARPGVRFAARAIDWLVIWIAFGLLVPPLLVLAPVVWLPIEALLLSRWGFTPGKWLLRIAVRDPEGRRPTFRDAFRRAAAVWTYGAGAYTPFGLATAVMAYAQLKRKLPVYWDTLGGSEVHHRPVGAARAVTAAVILGVAVAIFQTAGLW